MIQEKQQDLTKQKKTKNRVTELDKKIGKKIKIARLESSYKMTDIAHAINVSTQQVAKYESGINRISASQLKILAEYLQKDINYFFEKESEKDCLEYAVKTAELREAVKLFLKNIETCI